MYNYYVIVGVLEEIFKDGYIKVREHKSNSSFLMKLDDNLERPNEDLIGQLISTSGELKMTNLIELVCKRYIFTSGA